MFTASCRTAVKIVSRLPIAPTPTSSHASRLLCGDTTCRARQLAFTQSASSNDSFGDGAMSAPASSASWRRCGAVAGAPTSACSSPAPAPPGRPRSQARQTHVRQLSPGRSPASPACWRPAARSAAGRPSGAARCAAPGRRAASAGPVPAGPFVLVEDRRPRGCAPAVAGVERGGVEEVEGRLRGDHLDRVAARLQASYRSGVWIAATEPVTPSSTLAMPRSWWQLFDSVQQALPGSSRRLTRSIVAVQRAEDRPMRRPLPGCWPPSGRRRNGARMLGDLQQPLVADADFQLELDQHAAEAPVGRGSDRSAWAPAPGAATAPARRS